MANTKNTNTNSSAVVKSTNNVTMTMTLLNAAFGKAAPGTFQKRIGDSMNEVSDLIKDSTAVVDAFGNKLTSTGTDDKVRAFDRFYFENSTLNYRLWTTLYNDSWVFQRAINKPAEDMVKLGVDVKIEDSEKKKKVEERLLKHSSDMTNIFKWGALYGGSIGVMMFNGLKKEDYAQPINLVLDKLHKSTVSRIYITDRWYGISYNIDNIVSDLTSIDYGKPEMYEVTFANGDSWNVHHDWVIRYEHLNAPNLIKKGQLMGWGYAEGAHIFNELSRDEELKNAIQSLVNKCLIEVIKMDGMRGLFMGADDESSQQLQQRLEMVNWARSYNSLTFLDSQDEYQMNGFSGLGGLSDLLEKNMWTISAALEMQGVLYGDLKSGLGADTLALERYDDVIQGRANTLARPCYEKFLWIVYKWFDIQDVIDFSFGSLLVNEKQAKKEEKIDKHIQRLGNLLNDGLISITQYGRSLKKYVDDDILDFGIDEATLQEAEQRSKEESEGFDLNV